MHFDWAGSLVTHRLVQHRNGTYWPGRNGVNNSLVINRALNAKVSGTTKSKMPIHLKANASEKHFSVFDRAEHLN
jgi:beta-fructofuranosidase